MRLKRLHCREIGMKCSVSEACLEWKERMRVRIIVFELEWSECARSAHGKRKVREKMILFEMK